ncbi:MAG TPA: trehalase family glycosidase [Candidatus Cybelea sp.]|nr:trehalase family glycosidase [Candidatus Cybelea sp.]
MSARIFGSGERISLYEIDDTELAVGSTLGGPKGAIVIKASGALEKFYSSDLGETLLAGFGIAFWDGPTGSARAKLDGKFRIHPCFQEYEYRIDEGVTVLERLFVLNRFPVGDRVDPLTAYLTVEIRNDSNEVRLLDSLTGALLRGSTARDVRARHDRKLQAILAWNAAKPEQGRALRASPAPKSFEVTGDHGKMNRSHFAGGLSNKIARGVADPVALFHYHHRLAPGARHRLAFTLTGSAGGARGARRALVDAPRAATALAQSRRHFERVLDHSIVITPDVNVNRGVLWAKANMLRTQLCAPTGWCFVNDPTRSNNSVGRDTASFGLGSDYVTPEFSRESLRWYLRHAERKGKIVEYYDVRNGKPSDYGLNVNDDTPLIVLALAHHYRVTGDLEFLRESYAAAKRCADYLLTQRDARGLIWCTATKTAEWGIVGWRNIIDDYRISGASTEINSECFAAFAAMASLAQALGKQKESERFEREAAELRAAINEHLRDPITGLYYLDIDVDGQPRSNVTVDMIFPVLLGVADHDTAARVVSRLSVPSFWTEAGIRTVGRDDVEYSPTRSWGLLGGVWVGMTFIFALAAARFNSGLMAYALGTSFQHYSRDPGRNNTVPGQFSEWLHGETLANQGMMLSPWYPPRYVWSAIEGACGLDIHGPRLACNPRLAPQWKWIGARNVPFRGKRLTWFAARLPEPALYANFECASDFSLQVYGRDVTPMLQRGENVTEIALQRGSDYVIFLGNTAARTITTPLRFTRPLRGRYRLRYFTSLLGEWQQRENVEGRELERGLAVDVDASGFSVIELTRLRRSRERRA